MSRENKKPKKKLFRRIVLFLFMLVLASFTALAVYVFSRDAWQSFDAAKILNMDQTLHIYDSDGKKICTMHGLQNRQIVSLSHIPDHVKNAFIAAEDNRFYEHCGLDIRRIIGALIKDIQTGSIQQGASTISQQLIKQSHLSSAKTIERKIDEAILTLQLEREFTKNEILEMYLNFIYFGNGAYGVEAASQVYFGKSVSDISVAQGAMLAGIIKSPSRYAPHLNLDASVKRRNLVLNLMTENGYISAKDAEAAKQEKAIIIESQDSYPYGFFIDTVIDEAKEVLGLSVDEILSGGYKIYTTMDSGIQSCVEELYKNDDNFPKNAPDGTKCESAIVVLKTKTSEIAALMGGREHSTRRGFNRVTQMYRQPGSAIKPPLVFAPALEKYGYTAASILYDAPTDFNGYKPSNFDNQYNGYVTLREAVAKSLNVPAVDILYKIGVKNAQSFAETAGLVFEPEDNNLSTALGGLTKGISPLSLSASYVPFANGGIYNKPHCISKIVAYDGAIVYERKTTPVRFMSAENAYIMTNMLSDVIEGGTGRRMREAGIPLAGKSGTVGLAQTKLNKDSWMVAYNPEYVACAWMGFDKPDSEHALASDVTGGTYPALLLSKVFSHIYTNRPAPEFLKPFGVVEVKLDLKTLKDRHSLALASALTPDNSILTEYFTTNTIPKDVSQYWVIPSPPKDLKVEKAPNYGAVISFTPISKFARYKLYKQYSLTGTSKLIGEYSGSKDKITVWDDAAEGLPCYYYVVPYHPELKSLKMNAEGASSKKIYFNPNGIASPSPSVTNSVTPPITSQTPQSTSSPPGTPAPSPSRLPAPSSSSAPSPSHTPVILA